MGSFFLLFDPWIQFIYQFWYRKVFLLYWLCLSKGYLAKNPMWYVTRIPVLRVLEEWFSVVHASTGPLEGCNPPMSHHLDLAPRFGEGEQGSIDNTTDRQLSELVKEVVKGHPEGGGERILCFHSRPTSFYCYHYSLPYDRQIIAVPYRVLHSTFTDCGQVFS